MFVNIFCIIILVMIIITAAVISPHTHTKLDYIWLTSALPLTVDGEVLFFSQHKLRILVYYLN